MTVKKHNESVLRRREALLAAGAPIGTLIENDIAAIDAAVLMVTRRRTVDPKEKLAELRRLCSSREILSRIRHTNQLAPRDLSYLEIYVEILAVSKAGQVLAPIIAAVQKHYRAHPAANPAAADAVIAALKQITREMNGLLRCREALELAG